MNKHWKRNQQNGFILSVDGQEIGEMNVNFSGLNKSATFNIRQDQFTISARGFWNTSLVIADKSENEILRMYAEKWYANNWLVEYKGKTYKLSVRNNPLAEYLITEGDKLALAYGLQAQGGKVQVKITSMNEPSYFIFDFLLWYLFAPVASENMGDSLTFSLLTNQL